MLASWMESAFGIYFCNGRQTANWNTLPCNTSCTLPMLELLKLKQPEIRELLLLFLSTSIGRLLEYFPWLYYFGRCWSLLSDKGASLYSNKMSKAYLNSKATSEVSKHVQLELLRAAHSLSQQREARNTCTFIITCSSMDWVESKTPLRSNCVSGFRHKQRKYIFILTSWGKYILLTYHLHETSLLRPHFKNKL